jgi:hypothetical protein
MAIDIETENTGVDIFQDNKRIISVQIGKATDVALYYADSKDPAHDLSRARNRILEMLSNEHVFTGYNIERFDLPIIKKFLGIEIPSSNFIDLIHTDVIKSLNYSRSVYHLEDVCSCFGIPVKHKHRMSGKAEEYKTRPDVLSLANREAPKIAAKKGGTVEYAREEAIRKIAGGIAILDSYKEFVEKGGSKDTLFYEYATEDIVCEHRLFECVKQRQCRTS